MVVIDANTPPAAPDQVFADPNAVPEPRTVAPIDQPAAPIATPAVDWTADEAKRVVLADFDRAAAFRASQIEPLWQEAHATYVASQAGTRFWEGSRVPRANLQVHQAFQQVNALRPQIVDAICGADLDFDVEPGRAGVTIGECHIVRGIMQYLNRSLGGVVPFQTFRANIDRLVEDGLVYGNAVQEFGWDGPREEEVTRWQTQTLPEMMAAMHPQTGQMLQHPVTGAPIPVPTGRMVTHTGQVQVSERVNRFILDPCDLTDFYIDPNCRSVNVQAAQFCIRRRMMTVAQVASYRGQPGFDVPSDAELIRLAERKYSSQGETTRQEMSSQVGIDAPSQTDYSLDPRMKRLEVLRYFQQGRHVWMLARDFAMFNARNALGCLPFLNWCYVNKPGQFWGFSIPELLRTDQRYIKTLLDARADELNLIIHPPFVAKAGTFRTSSQAKLVPGRVMEVTGDPQKDVVRMEMGNVTQTAYVETQAAENRGQQKTGVTDLALLGTPASGGNSANRTATGVTAQTNASNSRVHGSVAYIEDTFLTPLFEQEWKLFTMYAGPEDVERIAGPDALQQLNLSPVDVLNSDPAFKMKTASRMKMRAAMQGGGLSTILQYALNGEVMSLFADQQGKTLDIEGLSELVCDTFSIPSASLYRPMTPQEQAAKQQRDAQVGQEKMQLQNARMQVMGQQADQRDETKILIAAIQALAQAGLLSKAFGLPSAVELEAEKLQGQLEAGAQGQRGAA